VCVLFGEPQFASVESKLNLVSASNFESEIDSILVSYGSDLCGVVKLEFEEGRHRLGGWAERYLYGY